MTTQNTNAPARPSFDLLAPIHGIATFFGGLSLAARRAHEIEHLMSLSDDALSRRGLKRNDIVRHVFGEPKRR